MYLSNSVELGCTQPNVYHYSSICCSVLVDILKISKCFACFFAHARETQDTGWGSMDTQNCPVRQVDVRVVDSKRTTLSSGKYRR